MTSRISPVRVGGGTNWAAVSTGQGGGTTHGIQQDGSLWAGHVVFQLLQFARGWHHHKLAIADQNRKPVRVGGAL